MTEEVTALSNAEMETQSSGQRPQSTVSQTPQRQSLLEEEKDLFKELAHAYSFSNPRQLWRIYMAWKLLKSLYLGPTYVFKDMETAMHLLFWREWLCLLEREEREAYSEWIKDKKSRYNPINMPHEIRGWVEPELRRKWQTAGPLVKIVDAVLLPTNRSGEVGLA